MDCEDDWQSVRVCKVFVGLGGGSLGPDLFVLRNLMYL